MKEKQKTYGKNPNISSKKQIKKLLFEKTFVKLTMEKYWQMILKQNSKTKFQKN